MANILRKKNKSEAYQREQIQSEQKVYDIGMTLCDFLHKVKYLQMRIVHVCKIVFLHFIVRTPIHNPQLAKVPYEVYFYLLHLSTCINQIQ